MSSPKAAEITQASLKELVDAFYGRIQQDKDLGPIFDRVIGQRPGGWPPHLEKMVAFWSAVLLGIPGFRGNPRIAHLNVPGIESRHFARWLFLFRLEVHRIFEPEPAAEIMMRAEQMGVNLSAAVREAASA